MEDYLVKFMDGGIKTIRTDDYLYPGCETCDYGSSYINEYYIHLTTGVLTIKASQMYDYPLTEGYMMETILPNVELIKTFTEQEFISWVKEKINHDIVFNKYRDTEVDVLFKSK